MSAAGALLITIPCLPVRRLAAPNGGGVTLVVRLSTLHPDNTAELMCAGHGDGTVHANHRPMILADEMDLDWSLLTITETRRSA